MKYKTKKELIYQQLREEILSGQYDFREKLVISRLAKRFECSEIPVREAMNLLESDGLIEIKPHVGAMVSTLSAKDIQEIFELRVELEGLATRFAVDQLTEDHLDDLRRILNESIKAYKEKNHVHFAELNFEFHMKIYAVCDNKLLIKMIKDLWSHTKRYPSIFRENDTHIQQSIKEHEEILAALEKRDSMLAENSMIKHKARAGKETLRVKQWEFYNRLNSLISNQGV
ncbi:GntR family transcriptional regulator [Bacillus sp. V5-8f]|uniref:GntR family transcriptional regulator n=1 Tax=Bacillus sp. V5-8f TaxID=2053044 RepID=UPI000C790791|nr:GntR family transcriptional regulator [Bacillus sp. V5-8f]PLT35180.1 GntR family transcriptional regulator [Bacillus sp. V5-8f]